MNTPKIRSNSEISRIELLIVLDYLLKYTDEYHLTSQQKIIEFARTNYDINMRRERIQEALDCLYEFTLNYDPFIFRMKKVKVGKTQYKYYKTSVFLDYDFIDYVTSSIKKNELIDDSTSDKVIEDFVSIIGSTYEQKLIKENPLLKDINTDRYSDIEIENYSRLKKISQDKYILKIKLIGNTFNDSNLSSERFDDDHYVDCYFYKMFNINNYLYAYFITEFGELITLSLKSFKIINESSDDEDIEKLFTAKNKEYASIEDFISKNGPFLNGSKRIYAEFELKKEHYQYVRDEFKKVFNFEMPIEKIKISKKLKFKDTKGNKYDDGYRVSFNTYKNVFDIFTDKLSILEKIDIKEPKYYKKVLSGRLKYLNLKLKEGL